MSTPAAATKIDVLHEFSGADGSDPTGGITLDPDTGVLYGTTKYGGAGFGTVFSLTPKPGTDKWKFQVIYAFKGGNDGSQPETGVVQNLNGTLYGTTHDGSALCDGCGTIFELIPPRSDGGDWKKKKAWDFSGDMVDGTIPSATPFIKAGALWGTTGSIGGPGGTIYRLDLRNDTLSIVYNPNTGIGNFVGYHPQGVVVTGQGVIYGTAFDGEASGTVFTFDSNGVGKVLHDFNGIDGQGPIVPPVRESDGTLIGTTVAGGNPSKNCPESPGCGTVWELVPFSPLKVLHSFKFFTNHKDGLSPMSPVAVDQTSGLVYGTTIAGGTGTTCGGNFGSCGTVFQVDDNRNYKVLWEFPKGGPAVPQGQLVFHSGALYGTSYDGGKACPDQHYLGCGTVWKLTP